jgi:hypothetical protein
MRLWTDDEIESARRILASYNRVDAALAEISEHVCRPGLTRSALKNAFAQRKLNPPSEYLATTPQPPAPRDAGAFLSYDIGVPAERRGNQIGDPFRGIDREPKVTLKETLDKMRNLQGLGSVQDEDLGDLADKYGSRAQATYLRKLEKQVGNKQYLGDCIERAITAAFEANPIRLSNCTVRPRHVAGRRMITALVSDIHFGLDVDKREIPGGGFNWTIASRRMARLATEIAAWKEHYRDDTDLQVVLGGDIIAGLIHLDDAGIKRLTEQIHGATMILVAFIDYLVRHFPKISVLCLPGNHDRTTEKRQLSQRWDSHAHSIYLGLALAFRNEPRVKFDVPLTGDGVVEFPGGKSLGFYTHGDVKPSIANVGRSLDIKPMLAALNKINASGAYSKPVRVMGMGHWHTPFLMPTGLGSIVVNGCVIGVDSFARNACGILGIDGAPAQLIFESVPGYELGDSRFIHLKPADDDSSYDRVIATPDLERWAA